MSSTKELLNAPIGKKPSHAPDSGHYDSARKGWNDRLEKSDDDKRKWRLQALAGYALTVAAVTGLFIVANKPKESPRFVMVYPNGDMKPVTQVNAAYKASDKDFQFHIAQWVEMIRNVSLDPVVVKNNWQRAYAFLTPQSTNKLNAWANLPDSPQKKVGLETVSAQVISVLPVSENSYQARWIETTYTDQGQVKKRANWTATFTVKQEPNVPKGMELINPGGLLITDFNWNSDVGTSSIQ